MSGARSILILYGSQSGNSEEVAIQTGNAALKHDLQPTVRAMDEISVSDIPKQTRVLICCSTWGDGEQPDNAIELFDYVEELNAGELEKMKFSVLALGDTAFDLFCEAGKEWDRVLEEKGATRIYDRVDCDVDYEDDAEEWIENVLSIFL